MSEAVASLPTPEGEGSAGAPTGRAGASVHSGTSPCLADVREAVAAVPDPELPDLTIEELGVLRDVRVVAGRVEVDLTPTYSGCPAMETIRDDVERSLLAVGVAEWSVRVVLSPAWSTDWMSASGRQKLRAAGTAPPDAPASGAAVLVALTVPCPRCGSGRTRETSRFGSTACKALRVCEECREPFDHFKAH